MLNTEYFEDKICDELKGAKCYALEALELKSTHPQWAKTLLDMSGTELAHAANLYKMYEEYYSAMISGYSSVPAKFQKQHDELAQAYMDKSANVKYMHEMYVR